MESPIKSLSLRADADGTVCLHKKINCGVYKSLSDFGLKVTDHVRFSGQFNNLSGYVFEVKKYLGERLIYMTGN